MADLVPADDSDDLDDAERARQHEAISEGSRLVDETPLGRRPVDSTLLPSGGPGR